MESVGTWNFTEGMSRRWLLGQGGAQRVLWIRMRGDWELNALAQGSLNCVKVQGWGAKDPTFGLS